jgi:hypothetical protein
VSPTQVTLPRGIHRPGPVVVETSSVTAVYILRRSVPWNRSAPVLIIELGDKTILSFDREAVARVEFEGEEGFAVTRARGATPDQETFALAAPRQAPAKRWKMAGALQELAGLKAAAWADEHARDLAKYGLDRPRRTIVVRDAAGGELARLLVGTVEGDRVHVMAAGAARVALVDKARVDALPNRVADVEDAATPETKAE